MLGGEEIPLMDASTTLASMFKLEDDASLFWSQSIGLWLQANDDAFDLLIEAEDGCGQAPFSSCFLCEQLRE